MSTFSSQNFKVGPCTVIFKDEVLGETKGTSAIRIRSKYHTFTNDQITGIPIIRQLQNIIISFETDIYAVDKGLDMLLDADGKITMEEINWMREPEYGELKLIPINPLNTTGYRFPRALLLRNSDLIFGDDEHKIKLEFEAVYDKNELMMEKITVSDADRIHLNQPITIAPAPLERAMTYYIAEKLGLTVDTNIFRGNLPINIDGCSVVFKGQQVDNSIKNAHYFISFFCIDASRDLVMGRVKELEEQFPIYGENINVDEIGNVQIQTIQKIAMEFNKIISDDGALKTFGELLLEVII
jgi:hypothetical protein